MTYFRRFVIGRVVIACVSLAFGLVLGFGGCYLLGW